MKRQLMRRRRRERGFGRIGDCNEMQEKRREERQREE